MLRVSQRYFDVLAAAETLRASEATLEAFTQQLAQAERRFKAGVVTVIDVEEARSARDAAAAGAIAAKRSLAVAGELLTELTGELHPDLERPGDELPASDTERRGEQAWVDLALDQNLAVVAARLGVDIAKRDVRIAQSGHLPTLDLYATTGAFDESATETVTNRNSTCARAAPPTATAPRMSSACSFWCRSSRVARPARGCASRWRCTARRASEWMAACAPPSARRAMPT